MKFTKILSFRLILLNLASIFIGLGSAGLTAAPLVEDAFEMGVGYASGATVDNLSGGTGFTTSWIVDKSSGDVNAERYVGTESGLTYSDGTHDLETSGGAMELVARGSGKAILRRSFPSQSGEIWLSFLAVMTTDSSWNWTLGLEDAVEGGQVALQNYSGSSVYRLNVTSETVLLEGVDPYDDPSDGTQAQLLVVKVLGAGEGDGAASVEAWINPSDLSDLSQGAGAYGKVSGLTLPELTTFFFDKGAAPEGFIDEVRIGKTVADVIPIGSGTVSGPEPEVGTSTYSFSDAETGTIAALQVLGWDFSDAQGTAEIKALSSVSPLTHALIVGGDTASQPVIRHDFGTTSTGSIEFDGFTRSSYSQARVALESADGSQLFAFYLIAPNKVAVEAGTGGLDEVVIANEGTNDLLNNDKGYSTFSVSWDGNAIDWTWQHFTIDGTLNDQASGSNATFAGAGYPSRLVLKTNKHDNAQRQFGISNLNITTGSSDGTTEPEPSESVPVDRDMIISTNQGSGADTFLQIGKSLDRGLRTYLAGQRYSEVGPDDQALRQIYIRFDLSSIDDVSLIERAALEMTVSHVGDSSLVHEHQIFGLNDDADGQLWSEVDLSLDTATVIPPGSSEDLLTDNNINSTTTTLLGTVEWGGAVGSGVQFSSPALIEFLAADSDGLVTLIIQWTEAVVYDGTNNDRLQFASRENQDLNQHAPQLVLDLVEVVDTGNLTAGERAELENLQARLFESYKSSGSVTQAENFLQLMNSDGTFSDISYTGSGAYEDHIARLTVWANVYAATSGAYAGDADLLTSFATSLDWWLTRDYIDSNWWWTYIGFPNRLSTLTALVANDLKESSPAVYNKLLGYYDRVYGHLLVDPHGGGANLADMSYYALLGAIMEMDVTKIETLVESGFGPVLQVLPSTSNEDGLRVDGTIYSHGPQLYNGTYGHELLSSALNGVALLQGTQWDLGQDAVAFLEKVVLDGLARMSYGNWFDYNAMGRGVSRNGSHNKASAFVNDIEKLLELEGTNTGELQRLRNEIAFDGNVQGTRGTGVSSFWYADFLTYQRPDFYTSVRMVSNRTEYNEKGNGEGIQHRYFGDGVNFILVNGNEYDNIPPVWNYEQLPGITAEQDGTTSPTINWGDLGRSAFAGSVNDGDAAVATMRLDHDGLTGWKSWFLFSDKIVALGSGINGPGASEPVYTTLNQKIAGSGKPASYGKGGTEASLDLGESATLNAPGWVWQEDIGYILHDGSPIASVDISTKTGSWADIGTGSSAAVEKSVFTLTLDHGANPSNAQYAYSILPAASLEATKSYAANPTIDVVQHSSTVHAVHDKESGKLGVAFLASGSSASLPDNLTIQSYGRILVIIDQDGGTYRLTVSDPLHTLQSISLLINRELTGENTMSFGGSQTQVTIPLPQGDYLGSPVTVEFVDPSVETVPWLGYFRDVGTSAEGGIFQSERFGYFQGDDWPWVWNFSTSSYYYIYDAVSIDVGMFWYSLADDSWLYSNTVLYPWHYLYRLDTWDMF